MFTTGRTRLVVRPQNTTVNPFNLFAREEVLWCVASSDPSTPSSIVWYHRPTNGTAIQLNTSARCDQGLHSQNCLGMSLGKFIRKVWRTWAEVFFVTASQAGISYQLISIRVPLLRNILKVYFTWHRDISICSRFTHTYPLIHVTQAYIICSPTVHFIFYCFWDLFLLSKNNLLLVFIVKH